MNLMKSIVLSMAIAGLLSGGTGLANTIRVPSDVATIQEAIDGAVNGDRVEVEPGVYQENLHFRGKAIHLVGLGEDVVIDGSGSPGPVVLFESGEQASSIIERMVIRGGAGQLLPDGTVYGGGVLCIGSSPTIRQNTIRENAAEVGGGVACTSGSSPMIQNNVIAENQCDSPFPAAAGGGGVACVASSPTIVGNSIMGNHVGNQGSGGGILCYSVSQPVVRGNTITSNTASFGGGGVAVSGFSFMFSEENRIRRNAASHGGGVAAWNSVSFFTNDDIEENWEEGGGGGGIWIQQASVHVRGGSMSLNLSRSDGGAIRAIQSTNLTLNEVLFVANYAAEFGGALAASTASAVVVQNCAFLRNTAERGGGIAATTQSSAQVLCSTFTQNSAFLGSAIVVSGAGATVSNSILWEDFIGREVHGAATVVASCVQGGHSGEGNIEEDPMFVAPSQGDFRLRIGSPCVDRGKDELAGALTQDFDGNPRFTDGARRDSSLIDMGAIELQPEIAALFGTVGGDSELEDVLFINGSAGNFRRRVESGESLKIEVVSPSNGPVNARYAVYVWVDEPDRSTIRPQPAAIGVMAFPTYISGGPENLPVAVWNTLGHYERLGTPHSKTYPAPAVLFEGSPGSIGQAYTIQGFLEDYSSGSPTFVSITNGVVIQFIP